MNKIFLNRVLPDHIVENNSKFTTFMGYWLDYLYSDMDINKLKSIIDIDDKDNQYLNNIKRSIGNNIQIDNIDILKNLKSVYSVKGTTQAIQYIFDFYYNSEAEFYYPRTEIMKLSNDTWVQIMKIKISDDKQCFYLDNDFTNTRLRGNESGAIGFVNKVEDNTIYIHMEFGKFLKDEMVYSL
jgi:hypothetical protein